MTKREIPFRPTHHDPPVAGPVYSLSMGMVVDPRLAHHPISPKADASKELKYIVVKAQLLIPGDGDPQKDAALVAEGKEIVWVGKQDDLPSKYVAKARHTFTVPYLMPGLWDCHVHLMALPDEAATWPAYLGFVAGEPVGAGARLVRLCWDAIQAGYTSVRDVAGYGPEMAATINDGAIVGPNIYGSGACISQLAGHGDVFSLPAGDVLLNLGVNPPGPGHFATKVSCIANGADECRQAVRLQIRRGAKCIKVLASGGVMSSDDDPMLAQFSAGELETIVDEATRMNRTVAAHCHGKPGILAAVRAGVTTVEHGTFMDDECIKLMKEKGTIYVATRMVNEILVEMGPLLPDKIRKKVQLVVEHHMDAYRAAVKAGVTIALGTDTGPMTNMAKEIEFAVEAGLTNLEAIKAATANAALTVGAQAPKTGQLKVGYEADFIGVTENPVNDVRVLQDRGSIRWVWKGGRLFKGPDVGPWGE